MAISTRTRFEILKRDGFRCRYCGADPTKCVLHVDHVLAIANGGTDDPVNLVASCRSCNLGKSAVPLEARKFAPPSSPDELLEQAEQIRAYLGAQKSLAMAMEEVVGTVVSHWQDQTGDHDYIPRDLPAKIKNALAYMSMGELIEAATVTASHVRHKSHDQQSRYFSAVVRNMRQRKQCAPEVFELLEDARAAGFRGLKAKTKRNGERSFTWIGPDKLPEALSAELWEHFDAIEAVS